MAWRIGNCIVRGELFNTSRNSVHGWLDVGGDCGLKLELVGNFDGDLAGRHFCFEVKLTAQQQDVNSDNVIDALAPRQIGVVESVALRGERKSCLYMEWHGQDGRVVMEIADPVIRWIESEDDEPDDVSLESSPEHPLTTSGLDDDGFEDNLDDAIEEGPFSTDDDPLMDEDPYELFSPDLEEQLEQSLDSSNATSSPAQEELRERPWDEVIPGIDEATKKMYEQWDEVVHGDKDEPLTSLFDPPLTLKPPEQIKDEAEAREWLTQLLARLAKLGVALDMCEHFTALDAYRLLIDEILPDAEIHPDTLSIGFICHYTTWEHCDQCSAEFEEDARDAEE